MSDQIPILKPSLGLAFILLLAGAATAEVKPDHDEVSQLIESVGSAAAVPLIDVAVATSRDLCYSARFNQESGVTPTEKTDQKIPLFHSASISKLFTAIAIMQLRDEEKLSLDDPVGKYVPAFAESPIQLQHLLTHTSGLRDRKRANGRTTRKEVDTYITSLARQRNKRRPGSTWRYADAGFNLLGRVIENLTNKPFPVVMKERLLTPLAMEHSDFDITALPEDARVVAFNKRGKKLNHPWDRAFLPSSGLQTTARDLARFASEVLTTDAPEKTDGLLRLQTLQEMLTVRIATKWTGVDQGYGWQISSSGPHPVWRHAGGEAGFESLLSIYPKAGIGIVALGNQKDWPRFCLVEQIRNTLENHESTLCSPR